MQVALTKGDAPGPERGVPPISPPPLPMAGPPLPRPGPPLPRPPDPAPEMPFWAGWGCPKLSSPKPPNPASPLLVAPELGCRRAGSHNGHCCQGTVRPGKSGRGQPACRRQSTSICSVIGTPGRVLLTQTSRVSLASSCASTGASVLQSGTARQAGMSFHQLLAQWGLTADPALVVDLTWYKLPSAAGTGFCSSPCPSRGTSQYCTPSTSSKLAPPKVSSPLMSYTCRRQRQPWCTVSDVVPS